MNLLLTGCFNYTDEQKTILSNLGYSIYFMQHEIDELPLDAKDIDATVCNGLFLNHPIDNFLNLKFIQLTSAGLDRIPINKVEERGIELHNAKGVYSIPMAEWALFRVLEHYKQGWFFKEEQNANRWTKHRGLKEIYGSSVGIIGAGNVGQEVAKRFKAMGAKVIGFDIHTNDIEGFDEVHHTNSLLQHINIFDVIIITAPLLPSTIGLISHDILSNMKENATIVNIARGGIIDQDALIKVLSDRTDIYAALDVFLEEPLSPLSPIWKMNNIAISPHNSFVSNGNNTRMFNVIYNNLKNYIKTYNEEIYTHISKK